VPDVVRQRFMRNASAIPCAILLALAVSPRLRAATDTPADPAAKVRELLPQLDHEDFRVRRRASLLLKNLPGDAWPEVKAALAGKGLTTEARRHLETVARVLRPRQANETRYNDLAWNRESAVAAYDAAGRHSPRWDAAAREALRLYPRPSFDPRLQPNQDAARQLAFERAISAGCDDPLVAYCYARLLDERGEDAPDRLRINRFYRQASDGIVSSRYPALRKCFVLVNNAKTLPSSAARELFKQVLDLLPAAAREPGVRPALLLGLARACADGLGVGAPKAEGYRAAQAALDAALPGRAEPLLLKGEFLSKLAYEVTPDELSKAAGAAGGAPRASADPPADPATEAMRRAEQALQQAYALDPTDARAATQMLLLRMRNAGHGFGGDDAGNAERAQTELWFRRATDADPDNYEACLRKLEYLDNDWRGGGPAEILRFGRECAAGGNHYGRIPFVLAEAHYRAADAQGDREAYLRDPEVWNEVRDVYETHLALFPDHDYYRNAFAKWAVDCGRWAEAERIFDAIGAAADVRVFGSRDAFDVYRGRAAEESSRQPQSRQRQSGSTKIR
jgi:hypothetical protein